MTSQFKVVLIAGATGSLGKQIAEAFLNKKIFEVKILIRPNIQDEKKQQLLNELKSKGAVLVEGALDDVNSLKKVLLGVDLVVSALSGPALGAEQINLIRASKEAGVKRFAPSEYGLDIEAPKQNGIDVPMFGSKIAAREELRKLNLEYVILETGLFNEYIVPLCGFDLEKGVVKFGGSGHQKFSTTLISDIAKVVPDISTHPNAGNKKVNIQGDLVTIEELIQLAETILGKKLERNQITAEQLKAQIASEQVPFVKFTLQAQLIVEHGLGNNPANFSEFTHEKLSPLKETLPRILKK